MPVQTGVNFSLDGGAELITMQFSWLAEVNGQPRVMMQPVIGISHFFLGFAHKLSQPGMLQPEPVQTHCTLTH